MEERQVMHQHSVFFAAVLLGITGSALLASEGPFDGRNFKGRIAWSSDGNFNDEDEWAASPVALAIFTGLANPRASQGVLPRREISPQDRRSNLWKMPDRARPSDRRG